MKTNALLIFCLFIALGVFNTSKAYGIGISPARHTWYTAENIPEDTITLSYTLYRAQRQYSQFRACDNNNGLNLTVTGWSTPGGVTRIDDTTLEIDWHAIEGVETINADVELEIHADWSVPDGPGNSWMTEGVVHIEIEKDPNVINGGIGIGGYGAALSQFSFLQNYSPRVQVQCSETITLGQEAAFEINIQDFSNFASRNGRWQYSYQIDWESDGVFDESESNLPYFLNGEEVPSPWESFTPGDVTGEFVLNHVFADSGQASVSIEVSDGVETTRLEIPVNVIPEPTMLALLAVGGLSLIRRRKN